MKNSSAHISTLVVLCLLCTLNNGFASDWKQWDVFRENFMSDEGRIIDPSSAQKITTSEGQAYSLFFALVAGDRENFELLLEWTENNLAEGNLRTTLPAWLWGKTEDGKWGVIDSNAASDVDIWLAYTLLEAGRRWNIPEYSRLGMDISELIIEREIVDIPELGQTLLPAPYGFNSTKNIWRLNPSYSPIQILTYMSTVDKRWEEVITTSMRLIIETSPAGFSPDWAEYRPELGFTGDISTKNIGSYNAIRVYLWAGMLHEKSPHKQVLLQQLEPMKAFVEAEGFVPEEVSCDTGITQNAGPVGFTAAMLPFLQASKSTTGLLSQLSLLLENPLSDYPDSYYSQVLGLFGLGWYQNKYCFSVSGQLLLGDQCH